MRIYNFNRLFHIEIDYVADNILPSSVITH